MTSGVISGFILYGKMFTKATVVKERHCCSMMEEVINYKCPNHDDPFDCYHSLIHYDAIFDEYGIMRHDTMFDESGNIIGEGSHIIYIIDYCPWCGTKLPASKRDRWFEELKKLGIEPSYDDVPEKYKTDEWYRIP